MSGLHSFVAESALTRNQPAAWLTLVIRKPKAAAKIIALPAINA